MIHKAKPELTLYLAEEALKNKFARVGVRLQEILEFQRDCRDYLSTENIRKIYARMMKAEVTKLMVEAVYQSLSEEDQEFIVMKYKNKKQMVAISLALNLSLAQLRIFVITLYWRKFRSTCCINSVKKTFLIEKKS